MTNTSWPIPTLLMFLALLMFGGSRAPGQEWKKDDPRKRWNPDTKGWMTPIEVEMAELEERGSNVSVWNANLVALFILLVLQWAIWFGSKAVFGPGSSVRYYLIAYGAWLFFLTTTVLAIIAGSQIDAWQAPNGASVAVFGMVLLATGVSWFCLSAWVGSESFRQKDLYVHKKSRPDYAPMFFGSWTTIAGVVLLGRLVQLTFFPGSVAVAEPKQKKPEFNSPPAKVEPEPETKGKIDDVDPTTANGLVATRDLVTGTLIGWPRQGGAFDWKRYSKAMPPPDVVDPLDVQPRGDISYVLAMPLEKGDYLTTSHVLGRSVLSPVHGKLPKVGELVDVFYRIGGTGKRQLLGKGTKVLRLETIALVKGVTTGVRIEMPFPEAKKLAQLKNAEFEFEVR